MKRQNPKQTKMLAFKPTLPAVLQGKQEQIERAGY